MVVGKASAPLRAKPKDILCIAKEYFLAEEHPGNVRYSKILKSYREEYYDACTSKKKAEKIRIIKQIIETVKGYGGRFVTYDDKTTTWKELSTASQREIVYGALHGDGTNNGEALGQFSRKTQQQQQQQQKMMMIPSYKTRPCRCLENAASAQF